MKKNIVLPELIYTLFFCLLPLTGYGQPKAGHFVYGLISYEITDSSIVSEKDAISIVDYLKEDFTPEIYFNKEWVVAISNKSDGSIKRMYNRKSRMLYSYSIKKYNHGKNKPESEVKTMSIDSIQSLKQHDKVLSAALDTMKSDLQVMEYPQKTKDIYGYACHKVTIPGLINYPTLDEIWVANFKNAPDLIFPDHLYFLIEGIPMEIIQDFQDIKIKWGVVDILPVKTDDTIFKQNDDGYEMSIDNTANLIYEGIHFIRTFQPNPD